MTLPPVLATLAVLCAAGWLWRAAWQRLRVPPAVSLMALGALAGPSGLALAPEAYTDVSTLLSKAAFALLLVRAGLSLEASTLKRVLLTGSILGTFPVLVELLVVTGISRLMLFSRWDMALLAGFLIAAVSPAVVLPTMLRVKERGLGAALLVPDRAMAQTIINAFVAQTGIVLLLRWISPAEGDPALAMSLLLLPLSVVGGIALGTGLGILFPAGLARTAAGGGASLGAAILACAIGAAAYFGGPLLHLENVFATVAAGHLVRRRLDSVAPEGVDASEAVRKRLAGAWRVAEIVLFANLGAAIDLAQLGGGLVLVGAGVIATALGARVITVALLLKKSRLNGREQTYLSMAHLPKATIQAVFGAVPLATFIAHGQAHLEGDGHAILILSVIAIVGTAPLGAVLLEQTARRLLRRDGHRAAAAWPDEPKRKRRADAASAIR